MVDRVAVGIDDRLEGEDEAFVLQGRLHVGRDRDEALVKLALGRACREDRIAVAARALGFVQRGFRARHRLDRRGALFQEHDRAGRRRHVQRAVGGFDGRAAHAREQAVGGKADLGFRAVREHEAETVAARPPDRVGRAQRAFEALADADQQRVGRRPAERVVDGREVVHADQQEGARRLVARGVFDGVVERFAQARGVEMPGQRIVVGQMLEPRFLFLAHRDGAQRAREAHGLAVVGEFGAAAVMHPDQGAAVAADAVVEIVGDAVDEMRRQRLQAVGQVLGIDARLEDLAGGREIGAHAEHVLGAPDPSHRVLREIPFVRGIARRIECEAREVG